VGIRGRDGICVITGMAPIYDAAHIFPLEKGNLWRYSRCITNMEDAAGASKTNSV